MMLIRACSLDENMPELTAHHTMPTMAINPTTTSTAPSAISDSRAGGGGKGG